MSDFEPLVSTKCAVEDMPAKLRLMAASTPLVRLTVTAEEARRLATALETGFRMVSDAKAIEETVSKARVLGDSIAATARRDREMAEMERLAAERFREEGRAWNARGSQLVAMAAAWSVAAMVIAPWL